MTTLEQTTPQLVDDGPVDEFVCHIYDALSLIEAKCGIHISNDKHKQMHDDNGHGGWIDAPKHLTHCPICGAPICEKCNSFRRR